MREHDERRRTTAPAGDLDEPVHPHPDDEAWLEDLGYPRLGQQIQSRTTQHEHGPNADGTQHGDATSDRPHRR